MLSSSYHGKILKWLKSRFSSIFYLSLICTFGVSLPTMMIDLALLSPNLFPRVFCSILTVLSLAWLLSAAILLGKETGVSPVRHHPRTLLICCLVGPGKTHFVDHGEDLRCTTFSRYKSSLLREQAVAKKAFVMQCGTFASLSWEFISSYLAHLS